MIMLIYNKEKKRVHNEVNTQINKKRLYFPIEEFELMTWKE